MTKVNQTKTDGDTVRLILSNGWLELFEKRHEPHQIVYHGKQASVDVVDATDLVPTIIRKLQRYKKHFMYNTDEFGLQYRLSPNSTIASQQFCGIKKDNGRITCLACCN